MARVTQFVHQPRHVRPAWALISTACPTAFGHPRSFISSEAFQALPIAISTCHHDGYPTGAALALRPWPAATTPAPLGFLKPSWKISRERNPAGHSSISGVGELNTLMTGATAGGMFPIYRCSYWRRMPGGTRLGSPVGGTDHHWEEVHPSASAPGTPESWLSNSGHIASQQGEAWVRCVAL